MMSVIEGIGDEVLLCGVVLLASILLMLAWSSTSVGDHQHFLGRVSIIVERNLGHANVREGLVAEDNRTENQETRNLGHANVREGLVAEDNRTENQETRNLGHANVREGSVEENNRTENQDNETKTTEPSAQNNASPESQPSVTVPPLTGEAPTNQELRERRLKHFKSATEKTAEIEEKKSTEESKESAKTDEAEKSDQTPTEVTEEQQEEDDTLESIRIKLKYLNDTQRLVNGRLEEKLGEFKQRHFAGELSGNKLVKLIFNGRLLRSDADTLRSCGLFDQCVIHCHVAQPPVAPVPGEPEGEQQELDLDLGHLMVPLFCILLALLWFFWFEFGHLFTATASTVLVSITGLLLVSLVALYPGERMFDLNFIRRN